MEGTLFVISAPSGAGKTTLIKTILDKYHNFIFSISYTTRKPRGNEKNGKEYFFIEKPTFESMIKNQEFLEYANVHDNYYGTGKKFVTENLKKGINVILDIDFQGAKIVKENLKNSSFEIVTIFILPPSFKILKERLEKRGTDSKEIILKRLKNALIEMENCFFYDYIIVNNIFKDACNHLESIINANFLKNRFMNNKAKKIINEYKIFLT